MWCWYRCFAALYLWVTWAISVFICRSESASLSKSAKASFNGSINVYEKDATRCQFNLFLAPPQQKNKPTFFKCSNRLRMGFCVSRVSCILSMCLGNASKAVLMFFTFRWSCSNQKIISYWFGVRVRKYFWARSYRLLNGWKDEGSRKLSGWCRVIAFGRGWGSRNQGKQGNRLRWRQWCVCYCQHKAAVLSLLGAKILLFWDLLWSRDLKCEFGSCINLPTIVPISSKAVRASLSNKRAGLIAIRSRSRWKKYFRDSLCWNQSGKLAAPMYVRSGLGRTQDWGLEESSWWFGGVWVCLGEGEEIASSIEKGVSPSSSPLAWCCITVHASEHTSPNHRHLLEGPFLEFLNNTQAALKRKTKIGASIISEFWRWHSRQNKKTKKFLKL